MIVRPAREQDVPLLHALLVMNGLDLHGVDYNRFSAPCLVGVVNGEIVGFAQAALAQPYAIITELVIARPYQRRGYGVRLLQHMETVLRCAGVTAWVTYSGGLRTEVHEQIERFGAQTTGEGRGFVRVLA